MNWHRRIPHIEYIPLIFIAIVLYKAADQFPVVIDLLRQFYGLLVPLVWAGAIAYLLNPILNVMEKRLHMGRKRSITLLYLVVAAIITGAVIVVVPVLFDSAADLVLELPGYLTKMQAWVIYKCQVFGVDKLAATYGIDINQLKPMQDEGQIGQALVKIKESLSGLAGTLLGVTTGVLSFLIGLIVSVYILKDKEKFAHGLWRVGVALFGRDQANWYAEVIKESDLVFSGFITGKVIDSLIIGVICYIGMLLLHVKYALLLTIMVALFNMIPYFGIYISMVPASLVTLFDSPSKALWIAVFLLLLQKFDAYILAPRILGDRVGLPPFWIIVSLLVGGEMFGIPGMILAVPTFAVIKRFFDAYVEKKYNETEQPDA